MSEKEFSGKVVLITGASSGIGATTAIHFAKLGASLALTGRNENNLKKTEQQCTDSPKTLIITADLTIENDIKQIMERTIQHFGKLDILINNAGIVICTNIENTTLEQFDRVFNTNVRSIFQLTQLAVPHLKETKGNIINISSLAGLRSFPSIISYCMSKSALDQFTQCVALEMAPHGVRVNSINPAVVETDLFKNAGMTEAMIKEFLENAKKVHLLGRVGQPDDVANAATFLASDRSSFITGVLLPVDSGRHASCPKRGGLFDECEDALFIFMSSHGNLTFMPQISPGMRIFMPI